MFLLKNKKLKMKFLYMFEQYSISRGLESKPFSQIDEIKEHINIKYPLFHKTPFLKNVPKILRSGIKLIPNKFLHLIGFGGIPNWVESGGIKKTGISFTNSFELVKSKWKGDITFIFDKEDLLEIYGDNFFIVKGGGESEEILLDVENISPNLIKGILFSDNVQINEIKRLNIKNIVVLYQLKNNTIIKL